MGTAHVSAQAAREAADTIARVGPAIVVLELDQERFEKLSKAAEEYGPFGLRKLQEKGTLEVRGCRLCCSRRRALLRLTSANSEPPPPPGRRAAPVLLFTHTHKHTFHTQNRLPCSWSR